MSWAGFMRIRWLGAKEVSDGVGIIRGQTMVTLSASGSFSPPGLKFMLCYLSLSLRPCQACVGSYSVCTVSLCATLLSLCLISPPSSPFHSSSIFYSSLFSVFECLCSLPCVKLPCPPYHSSPFCSFTSLLAFLHSSGLPLSQSGLPSPPAPSAVLLLCLCTPFSDRPMCSSLQHAPRGCSARS